MTNYECGFISKCAEYGIDGRMLLKIAFDMDPTGNFGTYDPTPSSPTVLREPSLSPPVDESKHLDAVVNSTNRQFYSSVLGPVAAASAVSGAPAIAAAGKWALPKLALGAHMAKGMANEAGKLIWSGGQNLIETGDPLLKPLGYVYRAATNVGPIAAYVGSKVPAVKNTYRRAVNWWNSTGKGTL